MYIFVYIRATAEAVDQVASNFILLTVPARYSCCGFLKLLSYVSMLNFCLHPMYVFISSSN